MCVMVMKRLLILLAVAFASMLTSALHIGFACSQERHVKFNRWGLDLYIQILFAQI